MKIQISELLLNFILKQQAFECKLSLGSLEINDNLRNYLNPNLKKFLFTEKESDLIKVSLMNKDKNHPKYEKIDLEIDISLGKLFINYKPEVLLKLLEFVNISNEKNKEIENIEEQNLNKSINESVISEVNNQVDETSIIKYKK